MFVTCRVGVGERGNAAISGGTSPFLRICETSRVCGSCGGGGVRIRERLLIVDSGQDCGEVYLCSTQLFSD